AGPPGAALLRLRARVRDGVPEVVVEVRGKATWLCVVQRQQRAVLAGLPEVGDLARDVVAELPDAAVTALLGDGEERIEGRWQAQVRLRDERAAKAGSGVAGAFHRRQVGFERRLAVLLPACRRAAALERRRVNLGVAVRPEILIRGAVEPSVGEGAAGDLVQRCLLGGEAEKVIAVRPRRVDAPPLGVALGADRHLAVGLYAELGSRDRVRAVAE